MNKYIANPTFCLYNEDIVYVDYDRSSWRYMNCERSLPKEDLDCFKIGVTIRQEYDIMAPYRIGKGGGSANGGDWKPSPSKPGDQRFLGEPGSIKQHGYSKTHIGNDGKADYERHETSHSNPNAHSNPHDHAVDWSNGFPCLGDAINYPNGAPPFEDVYGGEISSMNSGFTSSNLNEGCNFTGISDFKWCMKCGGEVVFRWNGTEYCCFGKLKRPEDQTIMMYISKTDSEADWETSEKWCATSDDVLEYMVGFDRLRDVITQVTVIERTI